MAVRDYLGIGAGAHGKISRYEHGELKLYRTQKTRMPQGYLNAHQRIPPKFVSKQQNIASEDIDVEVDTNCRAQ